MTTRRREWTLGAMYQAMQRDLEACQTENERINCRAVNVREIRDRAEQIRRHRPLTEFEQSVLERC